MINVILQHYKVKLTYIAIMLLQTHAVLVVFTANAANNNVLQHLSNFHHSSYTQSIHQCAL